MFEWCVVILLLALLAWFYRWRRKWGWIPRELRDAELAYAEKLFKAFGPVVLTAKVDRAYRKRDGAIVLVELKTRRRLRSYPSDVIELSAQRVISLALCNNVMCLTHKIPDRLLRLLIESIGMSTLVRPYTHLEVSAQPKRFVGESVGGFRTVNVKLI
ncbi:MAG: hypothetical protein LBI92_11640 [Azoarcus sp.]|jgi:hypothetical protein|nr:hypothetical protein [Azoarcus sp.]